MMIMRARLFVRQLIKNEKGATAIEYTLLAGLIGVVIVAILIGMQENLRTIWNFISDRIGDAADTAGGGGGTP